jgi:hypothetical protein
MSLKFKIFSKKLIAGTSGISYLCIISLFIKKVFFAVARKKTPTFRKDVKELYYLAGKKPDGSRYPWQEEQTALRSFTFHVCALWQEEQAAFTWTTWPLSVKSL